MALNYYHKHPDQAQLFMVSQAIVKRNFAKQIMEFDGKAAKDPKRIAQLAEREKDVAAAYRLFPGIGRIKGKSGKSKSPVYVDWSERRMTSSRTSWTAWFGSATPTEVKR